MYMRYLFDLGLRGAIAFALAINLDKSIFSEDKRRLLVTATLVIVLFTLLVLGGSTLPLLKVIYCLLLVRSFCNFLGRMCLYITNIMLQVIECKYIRKECAKCDEKCEV